MISVGIIPARAGFTIMSVGARRLKQDHPRSRGVYPAGHPLFDAVYGSSPLARGLPTHDNHIHRRHRIIPARAGFTSSTPSRTSAVSDHPRSRGVYWPDENLTPDGGGSSPLARGLPSASQSSQKVARIIPARAGFTKLPDKLKCMSRDHPRSRGVYASSCSSS